MSIAAPYKIFILLSITLLSWHSTNAQLSLQVLDGTNREPIPYAIVTNKTTKVDTKTDENGRFTIDAHIGDTLLCSRPGYNFSIQHITADKKALYMYPIVHKLNEVEVKSDMLRYKEDSAFNQSVYHKTLHDAKEKPKAGFNNGIVVSGLVTKFAFWVSGKGKKNKDFAKQLTSDNNQRYVNVRYNKNVVESTTTLRGDSTTQFLERYLMTYEFARNATDLEIKVWIRDNYKKWLGQ